MSMRRAETVAAALALGAALAAPAVRAEVKAAAAGGFVVRHEVVVRRDAKAAWARLLRMPDWWDPAHSYTQRSANFSLVAKPGGCFCERLPDGGFVEHLHVVFAWPGRQLRFTGGLGPLQAMTANGVLTFEFAPAGPAATRVTVTYVVSGYAPEGFEQIAGPVDEVLGQQVARYAGDARE